MTQALRDGLVLVQEAMVSTKVSVDDWLLTTLSLTYAEREEAEASAMAATGPNERALRRKGVAGRNSESVMIPGVTAQMSGQVFDVPPLTLGQLRRLMPKIRQLTDVGVGMGDTEIVFLIESSPPRCRATTRI